MGEVEDDDSSLPSGAGRTLMVGSPSKTDWAGTWDLIKAFFWLGTFLAFLGGIGYGIYAGAIWAKEQYFDTSDSVLEKAVKCYADAGKDPWRMEKCNKLAERADILTKREQAEKFCADKA